MEEKAVDAAGAEAEMAGKHLKHFISGAMFGAGDDEVMREVVEVGLAVEEVVLATEGIQSHPQRRAPGHRNGSGPRSCVF